ncbi:reverse transcriptase [Plakobranchus ocellatus]|uniref:Reverse transcriptase n=1 Tax=Plakobranchus ocellatus TaxID=259542 RepID=A0AAV4AS46_9GAST|nr:reverse transcriptase [Plakobranchus ocellatus]
MDDTTIICSKEDETRWMLTRLDDLMSWCRMDFKPKKSRSLSIRRGKVDEAFTVVEQQIPTVSQEPVKSLGRWYDLSMKDIRRGAETLELASESLLVINKCGLQGKFKIWCPQFMLIPQLLWPLLDNDICSSTVETIEAQINKFVLLIYKKMVGGSSGSFRRGNVLSKSKAKTPNEIYPRGV